MNKPRMKAADACLVYACFIAAVLFTAYLIWAAADWYADNSFIFSNNLVFENGAYLFGEFMAKCGTYIFYALALAAAGTVIRNSALQSAEAKPAEQSAEEEDDTPSEGYILGDIAKAAESAPAADEGEKKE